MYILCLTLALSFYFMLRLVLYFVVRNCVRARVWFPICVIHVKYLVCAAFVVALVSTCHSAVVIVACAFNIFVINQKDLCL